VDLSPSVVWHKFAALLEMPRPSEGEHVVRDALIHFAEEKGISYRQDEIGNVTLKVTGRGRGVDAPLLAVQAHMDMVGTCADGKLHDFFKDPISVIATKKVFRGVSTEVIQADGTTLGADNGIGLCMALALVDDPTLKDSPPLELVFTVDEETGLKGAKGISAELLTANRLLNLDTEEEGELYISCAGSVDLVASRAVVREPAPAGFQSLRVQVGELPGGHSGVEIHSSRVNPLVVLPAFLAQFEQSGLQFRVGLVSGGNARNAIPKQVEILLFIPASEEPNFVERAPKVWNSVAQSDSTALGTLTIGSETGDEVIEPLSLDCQTAILSGLAALPHGVKAWSESIPELVETSNNVARITLNADQFIIECMARSSVPNSLRQLTDEIQAPLAYHGFKVVTANESPGWEAEPESEVLQIAVEACRDVLQAEPQIKAVHAGLECGAFKRVNPRLQMVSFGPDILGAHTPEEHVSVPSVAKVYEVLKEVVRRHSRLGVA
jgi:dipeptidase D